MLSDSDVEMHEDAMRKVGGEIISFLPWMCWWQPAAGGTSARMQLVVRQHAGTGGMARMAISLVMSCVLAACRRHVLVHNQRQAH